MSESMEPGPDRVDEDELLEEHDDEGDDLLEEQEHVGYGEDEGERDESFPQ